MTIRKADQAALQCLDFVFHAYEHVRSEDTSHPLYWGTYRYDLCVRCGTVRRRIENTDGSIATNTSEYIWSDKYLFVKQFSREEARRELNRRAKAGPKTTVVRGTRGRPNLRVAM
jgi:hypothetical protein